MMRHFEGRLLRRRSCTPKHPIKIDILVQDKNVGQGPLCYTNQDVLRADIIIRYLEPVLFSLDAVDISLSGITEVLRFDDASGCEYAPVNKSTHQFLEMSLPSPLESSTSQSLESGVRILSIPAQFVFPDRLLPNRKRFKCSAESHSNLPPSLGREASLPGVGGVKELNDQSDYYCTVRYMIKVNVDGSKCEGRGWCGEATKTKDIRFMPRQQNFPEMSVPAFKSNEKHAESEDVLTATLPPVRAQCRTGSLTFQATNHPRLETLSADSNIQTPPSSTNGLCHIKIRFDPKHSTSSPPQLKRIQPKIISRAISSSTHLDARKASYGDCMYEESTRLPSPDIPPLTWILVSDPPLYDGTSSAQYFEATISIPLSLPDGKRWLPSFENCFVKREYFLNLRFSGYRTRNKLGGREWGVKLKVPIIVVYSGDKQLIDDGFDAVPEILPSYGK